MSTKKTPKPICFYLPQFHRIDENDEWWGEGFTEWTLVDQAKPLFDSHQQPRRPHADIGYYDLTDPAVRRKQGEMAKQYGIHGFCYYHYWFNGKRLLETPLNLMLRDGYPDIDFCLCWANEPWTRRWSGSESDVLQPQYYGNETDWTAHFETLLEFFQHKNYIRVDGKPIFSIYRIGHIPNADAMIAYWRLLAEKSGLPGLHIVAIEGSFKDNKIAPPYVDAVAEHQPSAVLNNSQPLIMRQAQVLPVEQFWRRCLSKEKLHDIQYPGVCHAWDNSPRRGPLGFVILPSRAERFTDHLLDIFKKVSEVEHEPFVFFNAWNEWSEGASLEPDDKFGYQWLESIKTALQGYSDSSGLVSPKANFSEAQLLEKPGGRSVARNWTGPDTDLINTIVLQGCSAKVVLDIGCAQAASSIHLKDYLGASRYIAIEPNIDWVKQAKKLISEVHCLDVDNPDFKEFENARIDFIVCAELMNRGADPQKLLTEMISVLQHDGLACIGFENAGYYKNIRALTAASGALTNDVEIEPANNPITLDKLLAMIKVAGFQAVKHYRVFDPKTPAQNQINENNNTVDIGSAKLSGLSRSQVESLFCSRIFLMVKPAKKVDRNDNSLRIKAIDPGFKLRKFDTENLSINSVIAPNDDLFKVYRKNESENEYFRSGLRQLSQLEQLVRTFCGRELADLNSIGDYASHYGRLLRTMRAFLPEVELCAYDIDEDALAFCSQELNCIPVKVDWQSDADLFPRHQLLTCASLITHTDYDFYCTVLKNWEKLLLPQGLLCFSFVGESYISKWVNGELDHYGEIDPEIRAKKVKEFESSGHTFAHFETRYSKQNRYGVGFMTEYLVKQEVEKHPSLEYLATIAGSKTPFNQDLAIVRKVDSS